MKDINILLNNGVDLKKSLDLFGDMATYDETIPDFLNEATTKIEKLKNLKNLRDLENYAIYVHSLKSDARYFGFEVLGEMAYQHEMESKAKNEKFINDNFDSLVKETEKVINIVKKYLNGDKAEPIKEKTNTKSILIADDSDLIIKIVKKILENDYNVIAVQSGQEAIYAIKENKDNLLAILLDLNMPGTNGYDVLKFMKENNLSDTIPVSILTGADDKDSINKAFDYPIVDMLNKPFNESSIKQVLEKTINAFNWK